MYDSDQRRRDHALPPAITEAEATNVKVLTRPRIDLYAFEIHLDKLRDILEKLMLSIDPQWYPKSSASANMFEEAEAETEHLVSQYLGSQQQLATHRYSVKLESSQWRIRTHLQSCVPN